MKMPIIRIITFIITLVLVLTLPWWVSVVLLLGLTIVFPLYLEVLFFGFLFDTLYSSRHGFPYTALTIVFVFLILVSFVKTRIRT